MNCKMSLLNLSCSLAVHTVSITHSQDLPNTFSQVVLNVLAVRFVFFMTFQHASQQRAADTDASAPARAYTRTE